MAKRNLRKIPEAVRRRLATFAQDDVVAACAKRVRPEDVERYRHLGLIREGDTLTIPPPRVPNPDQGAYSRMNVDGKEIVRRDLPMETRSYSVETSNWGDWSKGSHTMSWSREVYQREFVPPKELELSIEVIEQAGQDYVIKFAIDQVLNPRQERFEEYLLFNLNLLQENVAAADVFRSGATLAEYTRTIRVDWEILPPGTVDEVVRRMLMGKRPVTPDQQREMRERVEVLAELEPVEYVAGTTGFLRYFGAKFGEDFVVFENVRYGNALYVMFEQWQTLSQRSRIELLRSGVSDEYQRIEHREGWEDILKALVRECREEDGE